MLQRSVVVHSKVAPRARRPQTTAPSVVSVKSPAVFVAIGIQSLPVKPASCEAHVIFRLRALSPVVLQPEAV
jgi:hypothetical protein